MTDTGPATAGRPGLRRRSRLTAVVAALVTTVASTVVMVAGAAPAAAETVDLTRVDTVQVDGRGFGHGRGLSQNGARGAALRGLDHPAILDFYYPGAERYDAGDPTVRVRITSSARSDATGPLTTLTGSLLALDDLQRGTSTALPPGTSSCTARPSGDVLRVTCTGGAAPLEVVASAVRLRGGLGGTGLSLGPSTTRFYRGAVEVRREGAGVVGIVTGSMQEYLRGVVPLEMPSSWEPAALRAQTVAARTYALRSGADRPAGSTYDLCDTTACQVFQGMRTQTGSTTTVHEAASTDAAVAATGGLALRSGGRPAFTQFSAANGGWSTGSAVHPYLLARPDPYDGVTGSTSHRWTTSAPVARLSAAWPAVGRPVSLEVQTRDGNGEWGGRVLTARLTGTTGSVQVTGDQLRSALALRSSWFQLSTVSSDPYGSLDAVVRVPSGAEVRGWAADPDGRPVTVHVYVDGAATAVTQTGQPRPDVASVFPGAGPDSGFSLVVPVLGPGSHTVCAYAINTGAGSVNSTLGCAVVLAGVDPVGSLDDVTPGFGGATVSGWAFDPDSAAATQVHAYLDGAPVAVTTTGTPRSDVDAAVPGAGPDRGWAVAVAARPGSHRVCAYGISVGGGANALLGCSTFVVSGAPVGALDSVTALRAGVELRGWAADPDTEGTVGVHTYAAGWVGVDRTGAPRPDVAAAVGRASAVAGFGSRQPALGGAQRVCSYAIDVGGSTNTLLGCRSVTVASVAFGHLDQVSWAGGRLTVRGWAIDPDVVAPLPVHVYADGRFVGQVLAATPRPDLAALHPLHGGGHGADAQLALAERPTTVCAYAIDQRSSTTAPTEANPLLGCLPG